ncbi:MAG: signal peptidase II [Pseudomonadota bacterium]
MFARRRPSRMMALSGFTLAGLILIADQLVKHWILRIIDLDAGGAGSRIQVLDPWFNLTMVWNRGVSFGLFQADSLWQRLILIGFALAISALLAVWLTRAVRWMQAVAFGLIIGGAIGNVIDRIAYGAVADFLDFSGLWFPYVFNVADASISIGVVVLIADLLISGDDGRPRA